MYKQYKFFKILKRMFILIFILSTSVVVINQHKLYTREKNIQNELNEKIDNQKKTQDKLEKELHYKLTDDYVEKVAREKLGLVKKDEIIFVDN